MYILSLFHTWETRTPTDQLTGTKVHKVTQFWLHTLTAAGFDSLLFMRLTTKAICGC